MNEPNLPKMSTLLIKGQNVLVAGKLQSASILINKSTGIITNVHLGVDDNHEFDEVIDAGNLLVLPGLVDAHVSLFIS